ncbi:DegT/DnrJ/EryC1/StrS family aminotransferase [Cylindrospermopsis raciborskii]|uniref:DegT/DnrJ/EryC1/StrS family aminotransferase n=1 Tax=Cylindrospermopsis raciborskii TaxID=77022 RepID=UPI0011781BE9
MGFREGDFPVAEAYYGRAISLPMYPELTDADQLRVVEILGHVLGFGNYEQAKKHISRK